jgi:hypothetical protein
MPVSIWLGLEDCLQAINECWPCSVLDAGFGFGLFGHLLRQYFDVWEGRIQRAEWRIRIDGIEIDARSNQPHARYLYNDVFVGDIRELVPVHASRSPYDVILFGDVLEHLPKDDAVRLLRKSIALAMKRVSCAFRSETAGASKAAKSRITTVRRGRSRIFPGSPRRSDNTTTSVIPTRSWRSTLRQAAGSRSRRRTAASCKSKNACGDSSDNEATHEHEPRDRVDRQGDECLQHGVPLLLHRAKRLPQDDGPTKPLGMWSGCFWIRTGSTPSTLCGMAASRCCAADAFSKRRITIVPGTSCTSSTSCGAFTPIYDALRVVFERRAKRGPGLAFHDLPAAASPLAGMPGQ